MGGLRIGYQRDGIGPPLVLVHGAVCDGRVWRAQSEALCDTWTVVAWDAPGCGASSDAPDGFTMDDYAACLAGFIAAVGMERPHVVGHSFGGALTLALAARHGDVPASLIVVSGYAGWAGSLPPDEVADRLRLARALADQLPLTPESVPGLVSDAMPPSERDALAAIMADVRPAGTVTMATALAAADLRHDLAGIRVPTLVVHGEDDVRAPRYVADALHAAIAGSTLVTIPKAGHEVYADAPGAFTAEVRAFLGRLT